MEEPNTHSNEKEHNRLSRSVGNLLEQTDSIVYIIVGVCFVLGAILAIGYTFWDFFNSITNLNSPEVAIGTTSAGSEIAATSKVPPTGVLATTIITLISNLLLVLIIMEVLGTVIQYLKAHVTSLTPFLGIGIISATRGILSIGAKLSVQSAQGEEFNRDMIELGVNAVAILALGITLTLINRFSSKDEATKISVEGEHHG